MKSMVPLHSIMVSRPAPHGVKGEVQVDAHAEYKRTGKAFAFTPEEIDQITEMNDGQLEMSLRTPKDEAAVQDAQAAVAAAEPAASNAPTPTPEGTKAAAKAAKAAKGADDDL